MLGSSFWSVLPAPPHGCVRESLSRFLCDEAHRFNSDRAGNVGMIFAAMLVPVTSIIGMSVDFGRAMKMRTDLQTALDAAVLAGGREYQTSGDEDRAIARAETYLSRSFDDVAYTFVRKHVDPDESAIEMVVRAEVETTFLRILGEQAIDISAGSRADLSGAGRDMDLEIALMLDVTGSMGGQKIADLRDAASDLVEIILNGDRNGHTSRVAVVPFSEGVRPGDAYIAEVRGTPAGSFRFRDRNGRQQTYSLSKCVTERTGSEAYTDAAPGPGAYVGANYTSNGSCIPSNTILPLSANRSAILNKISLLTANGYTAGQLGTAWAWYTLSPEWADIWPAASRAAWARA